MTRLRQGVLVARTVEPLAGDLRRELGLGPPFEDEGVGEFGLRNAVMAVGDTFLEVIAPVDSGAPAQRWLERRGPGGYMVIVQVDDVAAVRRRATELGMRVVWHVDLPDISGTHLHPRDVGGTLLSVDEARPPQTWRWGGPAWAERIPASIANAALAGVTIAVPDPEEASERWSALLAVPRCAGDNEGVELALDGAVIRFVAAAAGEQGITGFDVRLDPGIRRGRDRLDAGGVAFTLRS